jgi:outer membrane protein
MGFGPLQNMENDVNYVSKALLGAAAVLAYAVPASAAAGDIIVRVRAIDAIPNEKGISGVADLTIDNAITPEVDFTYMATNNIGFELIAGTTRHTVGTGAANLAHASLLPPTLTAQYHLNPEGKIRPYVGAGINYTIFYNEKLTDVGKTALDSTNIDLHDNFGWALQAGTDIDLNSKIFLNLDIKYIGLSTNVYLDGAKLGKVDVNPIIVGVGLGFKL